MEFSVAQAMADLGTDRRNVISRSDYDSPGRKVRQDLVQRGDVNNALTARLARIATAGSSEGGDVNAIQAWNNQASFERNDVAEQLEDDGEGQSHRAALSARLRSGAQYEAQYEATEVRHGEERTLYLRDKSNNYVASATPRKSKQERFRELPRGSSTPRIVPKASSSSGGSRANKRGRVVSTPQNPNRASSPRSHGTVRYGPARKPSNQPSASMSASTQAAAMLREKYDATTHGTRSFTSPSPGVETAINLPAQRSDNVRASLPGQFNNAAEVPPSTEVTRIPANPFDTPSQTFTESARNGDGAHSRVSDLPKHSWHEQLKYTKMAEYHVAHPGPAADAYRTIDREGYFREAEKSLIKQAFRYAKNVQSQETQEYLKDNKDRQWMVHEAVKAKDFVERGALAEMDAYHADHPHLIPFGKAAKVNFKPESESSAGLPQQSNSAVESDRNGGATASTALAPTVAKGSRPITTTEEWKERFEDLFSRTPGSEGAASAASSQTVVARAEPADPIATTNMWEMRNSTETDALSSSNDSVIHAPWSEDAASAASSQTVVARAEPAEAAAASDAQQNSTSSIPPRSGCEHIENVDTAVAQPKDTSITPEFLISEMESIRARLNAMSSCISALGGPNGARASVAERKLEGVKMEEDGLWLSDEE
ncbi:hypothetical protein KC343_g11331 [Hortaea werneckii]|uniref:Uncharacterized protein n=1 Tax=Hortaea werneckii TaxID=91943 RepID=A0A3M7GH44_HORWE|nr:hypothetical protein KC352_g20825 [Hortaea werneckii]KAI7557737.1 hypothetical protein KC317_g11443 [Hortaea werneckii]KAI7605115.1 hypothetical protein KC346_g11163 [Hortaea werneckii]KAI7612086.1 hypothetical protein KC343_g11331 [Hortaea werneckii]KAI7651762.1 hypothetical protein KC319_g10817 [Hortaea werneckii]